MSQGAKLRDRKANDIFSKPQPQALKATPSAPVALPKDYVIGVEDVLNVVFWTAKELSAEVLVRPDSKISLPASRGPRNIDSYTGDARMRYALTRGVALYSEYLYYYYDLGGQAHLATAIPSVYKQRGIRFGFALFGQPLGR